jgi:formiminotetrahydrofolate cyclodeaminase
MSLQQETEEALKVFPTMLKVTRNKKSREDFTDKEWKDFKKAMQGWLDLEHNIECLKVAFNKFMDVSELIKAHNEKCIKRNYVKEEV